MNLRRAGDRSLQLLISNEEFLVSASHQLALITSLPFVHTARRYYRLDDSMRSSDCMPGGSSPSRPALREVDRIALSGGSKSRNKVSVGEPAEGSLVPVGERERFSSGHPPSRGMLLPGRCPGCAAVGVCPGPAPGVECGDAQWEAATPSRLDGSDALVFSFPLV